MRYFATVFFTAALSIGVAHGDDIETFAKVKAPTFVVVKEIDLPKQILTYGIWVQRTEHWAAPSIVKDQKSKIKVPKDVFAVEDRHVSLTRLRIETASGKKVTAADDLNGLKGKTVLLAPDLKGIDPIYLRLLAKDTIVITTVPAQPLPHEIEPKEGKGSKKCVGSEIKRAVDVRQVGRVRARFTWPYDSEELSLPGTRCLRIVRTWLPHNFIWAATTCNLACQQGIAKENSHHGRHAATKAR